MIFSFPLHSAAATACIFRIGQGEKNVKESKLFSIKEDKGASEGEVSKWKKRLRTAWRKQKEK